MFFKHGHSREGNKSSIYCAWQSMRQRCLNPKHKWYKRYGGRGITICERWLKSFEGFASDMGEKPTPKHSLDRINNDGNYEPGNCRWATWHQQAMNKMKVKFIKCRIMLTYQGQTKPRRDWAVEFGLSHVTLKARLRYGWPVHKALTHPVRDDGKH